MGIAIATALAYAAAAVLLLPACGGCVMCWRGMYGRRGDEHLHCARCGYDMVGHGNRPGRCPECGAAMDHSMSLAPAPRGLLPRSLALGIGMILLSCMLTSHAIAADPSAGGIGQMPPRGAMLQSLHKFLLQGFSHDAAATLHGYQRRDGHSDRGQHDRGNPPGFAQ